MKTSNKIILSFFVAALLIMTGVYATLYTKYKRGEYIAFDKVWEGQYDEHTLPPVKYVSITGVNLCSIHIATAPKIRLENSRPTNMAYKIVNDTLIVMGDSTLSKQDYERRERGNRKVTLYLTGKEVVNAFESNLSVKGTPDAASAPSLMANLYSHSELATGEYDNARRFFGSLQVTADNSAIRFRAGCVIDNLNIQSSNSTITNEKADIKQLQLAIDSNSTVILMGKNLKNAKIISNN
jgi:hypothetical protein